MNDPHNLQRFVDAQEGVFATAIAELHAGRKQSHWMWFVFPQLAGLGRSSTAQFYGIRSRGEALAYLAHPLLGPRLKEAVEALLPWRGKHGVEAIMGAVDALKLRSCLTLFDAIAPAGISGPALAAFYDGPDPGTLALLAEAR